MSDASSILRAFSVYCAAVAALWFAAGAFIAVQLFGFRSLGQQLGTDPVAVLLFGLVLVCSLLFMGTLHMAALRTPESPMGWRLRAIVLGLDLTTLVLWPLALPLLWFWFRPAVRVLHGLNEMGDDAMGDDEPGAAAPGVADAH
jgi:hypothetical protein